MLRKFTVKWSEPKKFEDGNFDIDIEGVYLIGYRRTGTYKRYVVYVGQGLIGERLTSHYNENQCIQNRVQKEDRVGYYRYAKCEIEDDRLDIELGLYRKYGGSEKLCNEADPAGSGRYTAIEVEGEFA